MADKYVRHDAAGGGDGSTTANSGGTGALTFAELLADTSAAAGTRYIVMATGTYTRSATGTFAHANGTPAANIVVTGGNSSGVVDGTRPTVQAGAGSITLFSVTGSHVRVDYLTLDGNSQTGTTGLAFGASYMWVRFCKAANCKTKGFDVNGGNQNFLIRCEATGCAGTAAIELQATGALALFCEAYANTTVGIRFSANTAAFGCVASANTGATTDGFGLSSVGAAMANCTSYGNGRAGFDLTGNSGFGTFLSGCLAYGNGGEGFATDGVKGGVILVNCAGGSNSGGNYNGSNLANVAGFVTLSGDPFTNASGGDFSLNGTSGAGAACRAAGFPGALPRGTSTGYADVGAVQHQDGGGTTPANPLSLMLNAPSSY